MDVNKRVLFLASCMALIATAMSFAIRGDIMSDFEEKFVGPYVSSGEGEAVDQEELVKTALGVIGGAAFFSFGLFILFGGPLVDLLGMGNLLRLAGACHVGGTLLTIFAPNFYTVVAATLIVGAGNGLVEAVCNPLIATLYPDEKTHKLTIFHAWFPGGIVIGGVLAFVFSKIGLGWEMKMALLLIPSVIYLVMIIGHKFPATERVTAGVSFGEMFTEALMRPLFWIIFAMMLLTAASELVPGMWIPNIYEDVMGDKGGILAVVWGSILMFILRQFFSKPVHNNISPTALLALTAPIAAVGLFMFKFAETPAVFFLAATLMYVGVCFWWPTMLGITSDRCPRTGALGLAIIGGAGSFATWLGGPIAGWLNDTYDPKGSLQRWAILPVVICIVFALVYFSDKARGGYKAEKLSAGE
jgi:MFS family permease